MDEKTLTVYAPQAPEGVSLRLLAAQQKAKTQTLRPALQQWAAQYGSRRPISARLAPARALHDRLIVVDGKTAWLLTQSLNAFAKRSPASIEKTNPEATGLKVAAYEDIWSASAPL